MLATEQQHDEIYSLVVKESRDDPRVRGVIGLLGDNEILTPEDLIATPPEILEGILPDQPSYPYSSRTLGRALKACAEAKRDISLLFEKRSPELINGV